MELKRVLAGATIAVLAATGLTGCDRTPSVDSIKDKCDLYASAITGEKITITVNGQSDEVSAKQIHCIVEQINGQPSIADKILDETNMKNRVQSITGWDIGWEKHKTNEAYQVRFFKNPDAKPAEMSPTDTRLEIIANGCGVLDKVGDAGHTLTMSNIKTDNISKVACVLKTAEVSDAIVSRIDQTRALDGMQEATWKDSTDNGYTMRWTYHGAHGLSFVLQSEN